jgi:hypothetical protein
VANALSTVTLNALIAVNTVRPYPLPSGFFDLDQYGQAVAVYRAPGKRNGVADKEGVTGTEVSVRDFHNYN